MTTQTDDRSTAERRAFWLAVACWALACVGLFVSSWLTTTFMVIGAAAIGFALGAQAERLR